MNAPNDNGEVRTERNGHVFTITVDRSAKMNGFTPEMFDALSDALTQLDEDPDLWVGVLAFAGKHTTAGLDLPRFAAAFASDGRNAPVDARVDAFALKRRCRKPVVMAVQGVTFTIGIEMLLAADIVVAADDCRFCQMEPKRGLAVFGGAHVRYVERAGWGNAMYHLFTCQEFSAERALQLGFVQEVHPFGKHMERARELAAIICECAPLGLRATKKAALTFIEAGEQAAVACIPQIREQVFATEDFKEGIRSFVERRQAKFVGR